jgi:hypothetical protein
MMLEMQEDATGTRAKNFMYIASFNPAEGEVLSEAQWDRVYEIFEKERGIPEGQQRIVYEHEKKGRIHRHVVWIRIDVEKMRAFPDALDLKVCEAAKHKIEAELDLQRTPGLLNRDPELPPADRRPKSWEMFRGMKSGIDPVDLKAEVTGLYKESANAADFVARLEAHGYSLCMGDRRGFVILDHAGDTHSLVRRLAGINTKQLNEFMEGIDRASLPSVDQAKERLQERKAEAQKADRATVVDEIQWQDALNKAAIAKEEKERRYVEKEPRQAERLAQPEKPQGQQAGQQGKKEATDAEHLAELAGPLAGKPEKPQGLQGTSAQIWEAMQRRDSAPAFVAALAARGLQFARVTEQDRSAYKQTEDDREDRDRPPLQFSGYVGYVQQKNAERVEQLQRSASALDFADGGKPPDEHAQAAVTAKVGTYVVINERGYLYHINQRTTGLYPAEVQSFLASMDKKPVQSVTAAREVQTQRREAETLKKAQNITSNHRQQSKATDPGKVINRGIRQGLSIIGGGINAFARAFESLFAPPAPKTGAQIEEEHRLNENAAAQAERAQGKAAYNAEHDSITAKQQDQIRQQQIAAEQHERLKSNQGRERDR